MARRRPSNIDEYEEELPDLPSTTRAVAWTAMLFALLALIISLATLFLAYRDGVLAKNVVMLSDELSRHWRKTPAGAQVTETTGTTRAVPQTRTTTRVEVTQATPTPSGEAIGTNPTEQARLTEIKRRLEELEGKLLSGDKNAALNLEQLRREMEGLRSFAGEATNRWVTPALTKLREARTLLQENGPQAAAVMRYLANDLARRMNSGEKGSAQSTARTDEFALPQPEPDQPRADANEEAPASAPLERDEYREWPPENGERADPPSRRSAE